MAGAGDKFGLGKFFTKGNVRGTSVAAKDPQEKAKQQRFKSRQSIDGSQASLRRARQRLRQRSIAAQLRHSAETPIHPLWTFLPSERRSHRDLVQLRMRRLWAWLKQSRQRIALVLILYVLIWSIPLLLGEPLLTVFAYLPLILVPPVGGLVYWLVWKEFHA